jgi:hypothetical protein
MERSNRRNASQTNYDVAHPAPQYFAYSDVEEVQSANPHILSYPPMFTYQPSQLPISQQWVPDFQADYYPRSFHFPEDQSILVHQVAANVIPQNALPASYMAPSSPLSGESSASSPPLFSSEESRSVSPQDVSTVAARVSQPVERFPDNPTVIIPYEVGPVCYHVLEKPSMPLNFLNDRQILLPQGCFETFKLLPVTIVQVSDLFRRRYTGHQLTATVSVMLME